MNKKILLGCYEVPGYGGASTATYKLFELMQNDGLDISYINIIDEQDPDYFRYVFGENYGNPKGLKNVFSCTLIGDLFGPHPELTNLINEISPDILIGRGYIASLLMKKAAAEKKIIFITTGCDQVSENIRRNIIKDAITLIQDAKGIPIVISKNEENAIEISDLIIAHSDMIMFFLKYYFPLNIGKIYSNVVWFAEWIYNNALGYSEQKKPFFDRDIDLLFISNTWTRLEKNYTLVKEMLKKCKNLKIHIIGDVEKKCSGAEYHGLLINRQDVLSLLGRTKTVACPSLFDSAPGILFEASAMGCNIVASKNCGNWRICNEELLVDPLNSHYFLEKIQLSLAKKYEDNIDYFLQTNSYKNLVETILAY